jgi:thiamine biosynthesis lipoprotein
MTHPRHGTAGKLKDMGRAVFTRNLFGAAVALTVSALAGFGLTTWLQDRTYTSHFENVLGTSMELRVLAKSDAAANRASAAVLAEIDREARILSGYDPSSEFSRWFRTRDRAESVSPELFDVLARFDLWRARTNGALDASAETVTRVWKAAASAGREPTEAEIAGAVAAVRHEHWRLNAVHRTATHLDDAPLVLNSFAKSYIVERAAVAGLDEAGVRGILVNIGGDVVIRGALREVVGIADPRANADNAGPLTRVNIQLQNMAVATSGGYRRGFDIGGMHYSHIVDPRTGRPTGHVLSATVVAPDAADAGALATAFCVLTPAESARLAKAVPGAEFMLVQADGRRIESAGWRDLTVAPAKPVQVPHAVATLQAAEQATWKANYELTIALEIAQQPNRANWPYIAVWIEDAARVPVRTLAVWYRRREARYLQDLSAWYRTARTNGIGEGTEAFATVSSATRAPGRYTLTWDGKDSAGKLVNAGAYTVNIEAAREHGTYQIIRQSLDLIGVAKQVTLPRNIEIASASLDYHRVAGK